MGWGIAQLAIMINTVAVYAYCNDAFPKHQVLKTFYLNAVLNYPTLTLNRIVFFFQGEISALINLTRVLGGE